MQNVGDILEQESEEARRSPLESEALTRAIYFVVGAAAAALVFFNLQFATEAILDVDGYYHIKWSRLLWDGMRRGFFPPAFPWLPLTTLNPKDYVDHHLLFHILLIPFTWFGDLRLGAKIAAAAFGSLALLSCYWLILRYRISYAFVWLIALLACSAPFLYRLSMTRAQGLSIIFMVAGISLLFTRRYRWLAPIAFLYVWSYSLFVLLCAAAVIWAFVIWWAERRIEWRPVLWTAVGTWAGFLINPYFPKNVALFIEHLIIKVRASDFSTSVGMEWYPYESWYFLQSSAVAFACMVVGYVAFSASERKEAKHPLFFLIFSTLLLVMNFRSRRFVEYWPPFAVLFAAFSLQPLLAVAKEQVARLPTDLLDELGPLFDRHERADEVERRAREGRRRAIAAVVIAIALGATLFFNVRETRATIAADETPYAYRAGMQWIRANVPQGEIIFNTDWDDFPKLFYYDSDHRYVSGLDPTYLLNKHPELSKLYEEITLGRVRDPAALIRDRFGARYVFTDNLKIHNDFYANAIESGWFEEVYTDPDGYCTVLRILDEWREPPIPPADDAGSNPSDGPADGTSDEAEEPMDDENVEEGAPTEGAEP